MKNICLVTWYNALNYGTCLQSCALIKTLKKMGYNAYIIENFKYFYYDFFSHPVLTVKKLSELIFNKYFKKKKAVILEKEYNTRQKKNNDFALKYSSIYQMKSYFDYLRLQKETDIFLTGSDQIWNPYIVKEAFLLSFVKGNKRKAAYASSIGVGKIPKEKRRLYKRTLSQFHKIGVREKSAQKELSELLNREIYHVLDPVYLLNKEDWLEFLPDTCPIDSKNDYIFCYFVGENQAWRDDIKLLQEKCGLTLYTVTSEARIAPDFGKTYADFGPEEFLSALLNAKYVITDSFHAIAFSVIFNKNFAVYKRFNDSDKTSQNSRIYDILKLFKLENRLVSSFSDLKILQNGIDYEKTNEIILKEREKSLKFLKEALE